MTQLRTMMLEELQRRNYSQTTVRTYLKAVEDFARHFHRPPDQLGREHIRSYQVYLLQVRKLGVRTVRLHTAALRFFFCKTLKRSYPVEEVPYPRAPRRLPVILTREEAIRLIESASNLFHRAMLITMYSTGMHRAELCNLKVGDIDSTRMIIHIRQGKGSKDRDVPLGSGTLETLREYWRWMRPKTYMFPGTINGSRADKPITPKFCGRLAAKPQRQRGSPKPYGLICSATALPRILWKAGPIFPPFRPCSGIPILNPPPSISTCPSATSKRPGHHWTTWSFPVPTR